MGETDNTVLKDMMTIMILYGVIIQIACLFLPGGKLKMAVGLWIGIAVGIGMAIHMKNSLEEALVMGEKEAAKHMQKSFGLRYILVAIVFVVVAWLKIANVLTLFIGVMGLKLSAYLQPTMHKLFAKFTKSK